MKKHPRHLLKPVLLAVTSLAFVTLAQGVAKADTVTAFFHVGLQSTVATGVTFSTSGTFVDLDNNFTSSLNGLTFQGGSFDLTLDAQQNVLQSIGTFTFTSGSGVPDGGTFLLTINFTSPSPAFPSSLTIIADISHDPTTGFFFITPTGAQTVFFNGGELTVSPLASGIDSEDTPPVGAVPEPATLVLLATGLAGVAGAARRRAKQRPSSA